MNRDFRESDWKKFRRLHELALDRFCQRVLDEAVGLAAAPDKSAHDRYLAVYRLMRDRDKELGHAFDNPRRSAALEQLVLIRSKGLLTDEEFAQFSDEARAAVEFLLDLGGR